MENLLQGFKRISELLFCSELETKNQSDFYREICLEVCI